MCLSFLLCPVLGCLLPSITALSCSLPRCTVLIFVFVFTEADFVAQPINQTSLSQSKRQIYIHLTFQTEKISLNRSAGLTYKLYPHELRTIYALIEELSQCNKYWLSLVHTRGPQIVNIANCFSPLVLSTCHNWELFIARQHRPLCFKKIRTTTTTAFLISNTVAPNPYSHSTALSSRSV